MGSNNHPKQVNRILSSILCFLFIPKSHAWRKPNFYSKFHWLCNIPIFFIYIFGFIFITNTGLAEEPPEILLWPEGAPLAVNNESAEQPSLILYLASPRNANGTAVIICPGGGYVHLAMDHEGHQVAEWFNSMGISAFICKYRVGTWDGKKNKYPVPFLDAQRALRMVRARAAEWQINPERIGMMGFSAGGHLASTVGTHFDNGQPDAADPIERVNSRPNFMILIYPVISLKTEYVHRGSRRALLGENADLNLVEQLSNETQVTSLTPPTFLIHTSNDQAVPPENSVLFYLALRAAGVPAEMHIYERGKHGFGMRAEDPILASWTQRFLSQGERVG